MAEDIKQIKSRSFWSVGSLLAQSSYAAGLGFVAFFILTLQSGVYLLGIYNTVLAMMSFYNYVTDLGLAAAIIQKKEVKEIDLNTAFYIQLFLASIAVIIGFSLSGQLFHLYKDLPHEAIYLYWAVLVSFLLLINKTIPSVLLEKKIMIYKVVLVQAIENTLFYSCVIVFSLMGFQIYSLVIAVLVRSVVGTAMIYILNPWVPKFMFSFESAKELLRFGIPYQGNSFLALIKDDLLVLYIGHVIGLKNLGYVTFGKKYAEFSIRLVMDNVNRVAFPLFSRFQGDKDLLRKSIEKILFYESFLIFPIIIGAIFVFDSLLHVVHGYYFKWNPSLTSFYFFSFSALFVSLSSPFMNFFNAIGKVKMTLYFMILWTALNWLVVPYFIRLFGYNGVSIAFFVISLTFVIVVAVVKHFINFSLIHTFRTTVTSTFLMAAYLVLIRWFTLYHLHNYYLHIVLSMIGAVGIYAYISYLQRGKHLYIELMDLLKRKK